jgi:hypothetical protein
MAQIPRTPLDLGAALRDAGRVLRTQQGLALLVLSIVMTVPATVAAAWLRQHPLLPGAGWLLSFGNGCINWLAAAAPHSLFVATATWGAAQTMMGRPVSWGEMLREGLRFTVPVLIVQALYILGMMAGMVLLLVPGVILALMWILVTQALILENLGIQQAFGRSRALTKGHRWALLGLLVAYTAILVAAEWVIFRITTPGMTFVLAAAAPVNAYGVVPIITAVLSPVVSVVTTALYLRLRDGHRASADVTAEVFA